MVVAFDSKHGPLQYATDLYRGNGDRSWGKLTGWQANLRAIALSLEGLRSVDRHGVTTSGEQYTGWKQLGAGAPIAMGAGSMTVEEAAATLIRLGHPTATDRAYAERVVIEVQATRDRIYRQAAKRWHPDAGGDAEVFRNLQDAKAVLDGAAT